MGRRHALGIGVIVLTLTGCAAAPETPPINGRFVRTVWAPLKGNRFRVNSPDTTRGKYKDRWEAKQTGRMMLKLDQDFKHVETASLYLELWGGHPGVANKRFTLNGKGAYTLPEVGAAGHNCTYSYPMTPLKVSELIRGENAFQFTCEKGSTFWGHYLIRAAAVRLLLWDSSPYVRTAGLTGFSSRLEAEVIEGTEKIRLQVKASKGLGAKVRSVEYWGKYVGYDENGDGEAHDWHGFTKDRRPVGIIGRSDKGWYEVIWDTSMLPHPRKLVVTAIVRFDSPDDLTYEMTPVEIAAPKAKARVSLHCARDLPKPFWSRAGREKTCTIDLDVDPADVERAELRVVIWDGGKGKTAKPFTLNGVALPVAGRGAHDVLYRVIPIDPKVLRRGANRIRLLSDTSHHGIEVCLPGPALVVRTKARDNATP